MQETNISWTDFSANFLKYRDPDGNVVHACVRISEGCRNCYACALAGRWGRAGKDFTAENMKPLTPFFDVTGAQKFLRARKVAGKKVFIGDMTDLFGEWVPDEIIDQHFAIFALRPDVTFQVLTKRAKRMRDYVLALSSERVERAAGAIGLSEEAECHIANAIAGVLGAGCNVGWPLRNMHLGVSVEDQKNADQRIPLLLETPAAVRWASIEPLLGPIDLAHVDYSSRLRDTLGDFAKFRAARDGEDIDSAVNEARASINAPAYLQVLTGHWFDGWDVGSDGKRLDGIVIGGESGGGHREMPLESAVQLARDAHAAGVKVFFKQDSGPRPGMRGRIPDDVWAMKEWPR